MTSTGRWIVTHGPGTITWERDDSPGKLVLFAIVAAAVTVGWVAHKFFSQPKLRRGRRQPLSHKPSRKSFSSQRAHLTRKANAVLERYQTLKRPARRLDTVQKRVTELLQSIESLKMYANALSAQDVYLHINDDTWSALMALDRELRDAAVDLKRRLRAAGIRDFPRFAAAESQPEHRTLQLLDQLQAQICHSQELAQWSIEKRLQIQSNRMLILPSDHHKVSLEASKPTPK